MEKILMNWYKKAKLADKDPQSDQNLFTACMFCDRWKTEEAPQWKTFEDLETEDQTKAQRALDTMTDNPQDIGISHGICDYCKPLLETLEKKWPRDKAETKYIRDKSLQS
jgi:hypothetical protein